MYSFDSTVFDKNWNSGDPENNGSSEVADDGTDETSQGGDMSQAFEDDCSDATDTETIEFDEVHRSAIRGADIEAVDPNDPFIQNAWHRKISGADFVENRRASRCRSLRVIACVILILATTAFAFGIYHLEQNEDGNENLVLETSGVNGSIKGGDEDKKDTGTHRNKETKHFFDHDHEQRANGNVTEEVFHVEMKYTAANSKTKNQLGV